MLRIKKWLRLAFARLVEVSPILASRILYYRAFRKRLHLQKPVTFNEKLMWLKLYEEDALKTKCADKYGVRDYVHARGLSEHLIKTYGVYDYVEDIDFEQLPERFVLKCTHGSSFNIVCANKYFLDKAHTVAQLQKWLQTDYSLYCAEPHYAKIKPRIVVEEFIGERGGRLPTDYKIHCFHGEPQIIQVVVDRDTPRKKNMLFSKEWVMLPYKKDTLLQDVCERPRELARMLEIARKLSEEFTYVRVDLYAVEGQVYFGELTFTPAACVDANLLEGADVQIGKLLDLTTVSTKKSDEQMMRRYMKKLGRKAFQLVVKSSPILASKILYMATFRKRLDLKTPQSINEKLMWLKLYEENSLKVQCADKLSVRNYVRERGYGHLLIDLYEVYDCAEAIDFAKLPESFAMKCTHGSGYNLFCENQATFDQEQARAQLQKWHATDYGMQRAELHYSKITPRIIIEPLIAQVTTEVPIDYQIHCFNGKPRYIEVIVNGQNNQDYILFSTTWEPLAVNEATIQFVGTIERPQKLAEMLKIARSLSEAFTYVRVDLYYVAEKVYFGELTFTPDACLDRDFICGAEYEIGKLLDLADLKRPGYIPSIKRVEEPLR